MSERKKGYWRVGANPHEYECSVCGYIMDTAHGYCGDCGAEMSEDIHSMPKGYKDAIGVLIDACNARAGCRGCPLRGWCSLKSSINISSWPDPRKESAE